MRWLRFIVTTVLLVSGATPRYAGAQPASGDDSEKQWLEQQDEAPDDDAEKAWIEEQDADIDTELELRPGSWGAAAEPAPQSEIVTPPSPEPAVSPQAHTAPRPGTEAAERARIRGPGREEDMIPLRFIWHGYYRARYNWVGNAPLPSVGGDFPTARASYGTMRLRLDPEVTYGPNPELPIARLRFTIDGFDNVVFGDNARVFGTSLFSVDQSITNTEGFDLRESLKLERAWIEFLVPVGQMRVGRMESHFGVGLLTHAGNGLAEWGDFLRGETFDRILFVTRPMTIGRTIKSGDGRKTPLIYAFAYDRLSQDQVVDPTIPRPPAATDYQFQPFQSSFPERSTAPLDYLSNLDARVNEIVNVVAWLDEDWGRHVDDELFAGVYVVYRWQESTKSKIPIVDAAWRLQHQVGDRGLAIQTEGEFYTILGKSGALRFTGDCPPAPCNKGKAAIYNVLGRLGVTKPGKWGTRLEGGFASGDDNMLFNDKLTTRGFNTNVKVGLLTYQVALLALSYDGLAPFNALELGANGSVFNAKYLYPQARFTIVPGLELHGTMLFSYAHQLDPVLYAVTENKCGLKGKCWMGWETNLALRAKIGEDIVWVDLEGGFMQPGGAFKNAGFSDDWLWTIQMRAAMVF